VITARHTTQDILRPSSYTLVLPSGKQLTLCLLATFILEAVPFLAYAPFPSFCRF
jgi:hypothetical protein